MKIPTGSCWVKDRKRCSLSRKVSKFCWRPSISPFSSRCRSPFRRKRSISAFNPRQSSLKATTPAIIAQGDDALFEGIPFGHEPAVPAKQDDGGNPNQSQQYQPAADPKPQPIITESAFGQLDCPRRTGGGCRRHPAATKQNQ